MTRSPLSIRPPATFPTRRTTATRCGRASTTEAAAAGERIVIEAKSSKRVSIVDAQQEIEEARNNRIASVGVVVLAKNTALHGLQPFTRIDHDLFVIWDAADPLTDIYLSAAVSVAKTLLFRQKATES